MPARILGSLALLIGAVATERFVYYGYRAFLAITLMHSLGLTAVKMSAIMAEIMITSLLASLVAGGLAFVVPPRIIAAVGCVIAALGLLLFSAGSSEALITTGTLIVALGSGLVRPCIYAYAARVLTYEGETELVAPSLRRFTSMACFLTLLLAAVNLAAFVAPMFFGALMDRLSFRVPALMGAVLNVVAGAMFGVSILVDSEKSAPSDTPPAQTAYRTEPGTATPGAGANPLTVLLALGLAIPSALVYLVEATADQPQLSGESMTQFGLLHGVQLGGTVVAAIALCIVLLVLAQKRSSVSVALFIGAGFAAFAVGALFTLVPSFPIRLLGMTVMGLAEPLYSLAMVFAALAVRGKAATIIVAGFLLIEMVGAQLGNPLAAIEGVGAIAAAVGAVILIVAGIVLAVLSRRIRTVFEAA